MIHRDEDRLYIERACNLWTVLMARFLLCKFCELQSVMIIGTGIERVIKEIVRKPMTSTGLMLRNNTEVRRTKVAQCSSLKG